MDERVREMEEKERDVVGRIREIHSGEGDRYIREKEMDTFGRRKETQLGEGG